LGFNILDNDKAFTKNSYSRFQSGKDVFGSLGIFFLSDSKENFKRMPIRKYIELTLFSFIFKIIWPSRYEILRRYSMGRRWFCPVKFKGYEKTIHKYTSKRYCLVDLPIWPVVLISNNHWMESVIPSDDFKFHLWFNDVTMQFLTKDKETLVDTKLAIFNNQFIKTKYNFSKCSASAGKAGEIDHVEVYGPHLKSFKRRWGFDYEEPYIDFESVRSRYKNTLVEKLYDHDCRNGPLKMYDA